MGDGRARARSPHDTLSRPLPRWAQSRFFNIRSANLPDTLTALAWRAVDGSAYDPDADDQPVTGAAGPGDGTVPAWSAWHARTPRAQCFDLVHAGEHLSLMEHQETLAVIHHLVETGALPAAVTVPDATYGGDKPRASDAELSAFLADAAAGRLALADPRVTDEAMLNRLIAGTSLC